MDIIKDRTFIFIRLTKTYSNRFGSFTIKCLESIKRR